MGLPAGALDEYDVRYTDDVVFPVQVSERGEDLLHLSLMHSAAHRFYARGTALKYMDGQRAFFSSPTLRRLVGTGGLPAFGTTRQFRTLVTHVLEQDHQATLTPARSGEDALYVDVAHAHRDRVKTMLLGMRVGMEGVRAYDVYSYPNPYHSEGGQIAPLWAASDIERFAPVDQQIRSRLFGMATHFRLPGIGWTPRPPLVDTSVGRIYQRAVELGLPPAVLLIIRIAIESGARISEVLALTFEDWYLEGVFGVKLKAINKGSRGRRTKVIEVSAATARAIAEFVDEARRSLDGRGWSMRDYRDAAMEGLVADLKTPLFLTRLREGYTYNGFLYHFAKIQEDDCELVCHHLRHEFVNRNLDRLWALYGHDAALLKEHTDALIDYMAWTCGERMLYVYSARHRRARQAQLKADFHRSLLDETGRVDAIFIDSTPLPFPQGAQPLDVDHDDTEDFLNFEDEMEAA